MEPIIVGLSVAAILRVENRGPDPATISFRLNLMEGDIRLFVEDPEGRKRIIKGWQADAALRRGEVPPGQQIESSVNLLFTPEGVVFPKPGQYVIRAEYDSAPNAAPVVSKPVRVTARSPESAAEREVASLLQDHVAREALVLAQSDSAADKLQALAKQFPATLDGKLARLLLAAGDGTGVDMDAALGSADPITLARWITMLSTPYSTMGARLPDHFSAALESGDLDGSADKATDLATRNQALRIIAKKPFERK